jgi:hypothetical protein
VVDVEQRYGIESLHLGEASQPLQVRAIERNDEIERIPNVLHHSLDAGDIVEPGRYGVRTGQGWLLTHLAQRPAQANYAAKGIPIRSDVAY